MERGDILFEAANVKFFDQDLTVNGKELRVAI